VPVHPRRGRAVQVDPIKPTLKAPGTKCLKLKYDEPLPIFAFNFNLHRYNEAVTTMMLDPVNQCLVAAMMDRKIRLFDMAQLEGLKAGAYTRPLFGLT